MKRTVYYIMAVLLLMLGGCRRKSDPVLNYSQNDRMAFGYAYDSYAAKFDVMWKGMNANYALWDYEYDNGLDWDKVYDIYRPKFEALDNQQKQVTDAQLRSLMDSVLSPLHDGHLMVSLHNHATGSFVSASPGWMRVLGGRKNEYCAVNNKSIDKEVYSYYRNTGGIVEERYANTNTLQTTALPVLKRLREETAELKAKDSVGTITPDERETLLLDSTIVKELERVMALSASSSHPAAAINAYNIIVYRYEYLHIPGLDPVDPKIADYGMCLSYILFKGLNGYIAYMAFDHFKLSVFLDQDFTKQTFGTLSSSTQAVIDDLRATWQAWFDAVQTHHKAGDLDGVIIDVRSNNGGYINDFQYVLGALLPTGDYHNANARFKRGTGRYDYSPVMPQYMPTLNTEHVTVTAPIVTLCNCASASMAEQTAYGTKSLDNGTFIGTRTYGAFSALSSSEIYSDNYAGLVGVSGETPVFCYIPLEVALTKENQVLEGYGVTPDIEVALDIDVWSQGIGPDTQLERALQFIRTGN